MRKSFLKGVFVATLITVMATTPVLADEVSDLQAAQSQNAAELDQKNSELMILVTQMDELELQAANLQNEMAEVNDQLAVAQEKQAQQYDNMKLRIKFMYEKNDSTFASAIFSSQSMGEMLSKTEYVQQVYSYDRDMLNQMAATAKEIAELKTTLEEDEAALTASHESMISKQALLLSSIDELQAKGIDISSSLASASAAASAAHQIELSNATNSVVNSANTSAGSESSSSGSANTVAPSAPIVSGDSSIGVAALSIAYSYYGVNYVYGGSSPSGFDCSGLTSYVYAQLGISLPRSSAAQASAGYEVGIAGIQPGDIVCYPGHVAIYAGGGTVFNATQEGDICRESPLYMAPIIAVRRVY